MIVDILNEFARYASTLDDLKVLEIIKSRTMQHGTNIFIILLRINSFLDFIFGLSLVVIISPSEVPKL